MDVKNLFYCDFVCVLCKKFCEMFICEKNIVVLVEEMLWWKEV